MANQNRIPVAELQLAQNGDPTGSVANHSFDVFSRLRDRLGELITRQIVSETNNMGVQVEAATAAAVPLTTLLSKASVASILELVQDVQAHGAALSKAADVLFGDTDAAADDTNQVSVGDSNLLATVHALTAIQVAVNTALGLLTSDKQQLLDDIVKDDEHRVMEGPALLPGPPPSSSQQPELDEAKVVNSGVYVHESEAELEATDEPAAVQAETFPTEILVENINHLMFVVHGIGEHKDFVVESYDDDNGSTGESGNFRELFSTMRDSLFSKCVPMEAVTMIYVFMWVKKCREIPLSLEIHPIEWHSEVHKSGVDDVFDKISPAASTTLRDVNKRLIMDVLYYSAPKYGQMIVDTVTKQMNDKYTAFMAANPGWQGFVSVFAHSLGTLVAYDILTHEAGEVGSNGVVFPGLAFPVENLFCAGSPVPIFALSRGQLDIQDSVCTGGLRRPKVNHYFNLFHPADPIAYRVEPLVDVGMSDYPAIKLQKNKTFGEMVLIYDKLTDIASVCNDWDGARIDFEVQRRFFEGPIDTLYAPLSHSVYWSSEAVVTITLLAICRPVILEFQKYRVQLLVL
ncbi:hypothetical protein DYB35_011062 [Aphanomyces astaci]|uniref:DDHD domain-containing protein n=1 Tax=Aphanomyces astaci TaxID=112090 RepID=A0A418DRQ1_APHAT|nr:hypothetical protein DYB35_011062 [Aphanomyces astaci]